jgi:DNA-binding CsgD family transcriptional regulator
MLCSIFLLFCVVSVDGQQQSTFQIRNYSKQEYQAESQNWSIVQDQRGFIYAANNKGLLEFDGVEWSFYPLPAGTVIRSVAVDSKNRIYTSGYREMGYWERDRTGRLDYTSLNPVAEPLFTKNEEFWNTLIIGERVYFHSFSSVFIYEDNAFRVIRAGSLITSISNLDGELCMHIAGEGLFLLRDTIPVPFIVDDKIRDDQVHFCLFMKDSSILIGTSSEGLFRYRENILNGFAEEWKPYFKENKVNRGALTRDGNIAVGTLLDGILIFDAAGKLVTRINSTQGLQNNTVLGLSCDKENNLWVALDQGLDFISFNFDPSYTLFTVNDIGAVYSSSVYRGDLYLCTNQGVYYRPWDAPGDQFRIIPGTQGQAWSSGVYSGQLIVCHNAGTFRIDNHRAERISEVSGGFNITGNPLRENSLVQSTYSNIVFFERKEGEWKYSYQLPEFHDLIRYIELDHRNTIWASHMHRGIYRLKLSDGQDSVVESRYYGEPVFGKDQGLHVFKIENRIVFTTGQELFTFNDLQDTIIPYTQLNEKLGSFSESHRIVPAGNHHYWFISRKGIGLFLIVDHEITLVKDYPIDLFKDHLIPGYENIFPLSSTRGLLCLDNGYAILRADQPDLSTLIEGNRLTLKSIEISGRSGNREELPVDNGSIRVPFNRNSLTLRFSFPYFSGQTMAFQSYLEGLDAEWSEPRTIPVFNFARIPPGEYKIRIRAFNEWGRSSIEEVILMEVEPPLYLGPSSMILYAVLCVILFLSGRYLLIQRIRARERKIKEVKEKELIRLRNEKLDSELSFKSQELATSTMAIIKKNEFLISLREVLKKQKEDLGTRFPEKYHNQIMRMIDGNISSLDDWNVFEIHFEKAHEKFLQKMVTMFPQLSQSDLRLCAYLRMNLSSKEIAPLLRISYRGVENHRYRLRKKLLLKKDVNLTEFILAI